MRGPRLTVRARLTALYTGLFALCGTIIIAVSYLLVAQLGATTVRKPPSHHGGAVVTVGELKACRAEQARPDPDKQALERCNKAFQHRGAEEQQALVQSRLLDYSLITLGVTLALAAVLGWVFAGRALRPVQQITAAARAASEHNLSARVALTGPRDELSELAATFDAMLDRLQTAFEGQRRFIADASHELRTPLAVMRACVDVVLANPDSSSEDLRSMAADVRIEVDRAEHLIAALLLLARNSRGLVVRDEIDLASVAEDVLDDTDATGLAVHVNLEPAVIAGDPVLAEHLVANLVGNAIRYNLPGGDIWISTRAHDRRSELTVANTGRPVDAEDAERVFEPFLRLSGRIGQDGSGLGLAIVASITEVHGGTVTATPRPDGGLSVTVLIPAATSSTPFSTPSPTPIVGRRPTR